MALTAPTQSMLPADPFVHEGMLRVPARPSADTIARLSGLEGLARSIPTAVMPIIAFEALGSKAAVSIAYIIGSGLALLATLNIGRFETRLARRTIVTISLALLMASAVVSAFAAGPTLAVAIGLLATHTAIFAATLSLYIVDNIARRDLTYSESRRLFYTALAWTVGPMIGLWLSTQAGQIAPFVLSALFSVATLTFFRYKPFGGSQNWKRASTSPPPTRNIVRFFRQRYMRISYMITFTRGLFWAALFIYGPLYVLESGAPSWVAGALLSVVAALLVTSPAIYRATSRFGTRTMIVIGFLTTGIALVALAAMGDARPVGILLWVVAAAGASVVDVVNNVPFMRTVRPSEKVEMTSVFSTWREVSSLAAPILAVLVLAVLPFAAFYVLLSVLCALAAIATTYLPRRI